MNQLSIQFSKQCAWNWYQRECIQQRQRRCFKNAKINWIAVHFATSNAKNMRRVIIRVQSSTLVMFESNPKIQQNRTHHSGHYFSPLNMSNPIQTLFRLNGMAHMELWTLSIITIITVARGRKGLRRVICRWGRCKSQMNFHFRETHQMQCINNNLNFAHYKLIKMTSNLFDSRNVPIWSICTI